MKAKSPAAPASAGNRYSLISAVCFTVYFCLNILPRFDWVFWDDAYIIVFFMLWSAGFLWVAAAVGLRKVRGVFFASCCRCLTAVPFFVINLTMQYFDWVLIPLMAAYAAMAAMILLSAKDRTAVRRFRFVPGILLTVRFLISPLYFNFDFASFFTDAVSCLYFFSNLAEAAALFLAGAWLSREDPSGLPARKKLQIDKPALGSAALTAGVSLFVLEAAAGLAQLVDPQGGLLRVDLRSAAFHAVFLAISLTAGIFVFLREHRKTA